MFRKNKNQKNQTGGKNTNKRNAFKNLITLYPNKGVNTMYGLNNNTGFSYSQQDNNFKKMSRFINSTNFGEKTKNISNGLNALNNFQEIGQGETGGQRLQSLAKLLTTFI